MTCRAERSLPRSRWSSVVVCYVASRISSYHWASKGCGNGNLNWMDCGWSGSPVVFFFSVGMSVVGVCAWWL